MATRLSYWLITFVAACGGLAAWLLPPSRFDRFVRAEVPEDVRYRETTAELQLAHGILVSQRWVDSLSALAVQTAVDGVALAHPPSDIVSPEGFDEWRELLSSRVRSLQPRDPVMVVGMFFQSDRHGASDGVLLPRFGARPQTYVGTRDGSPYCLVVYPKRYPVSNSELRSAARLESCLMHAKYGVPGAAIAAWLESGGFAFARDVRLAEFDDLGLRRARMLPFGPFRPVEANLPTTGCVAGKLEACTAAFMAGGTSRSFLPLVEQSPIAYVHEGGFSVFGRKSDAILAELEAEYGPDSFARFWQSDSEVESAFRAAFGTEPGAWLRDWVQTEIGSYRSSPMPSGKAVLFAILLLSALSVAACVVAMRRGVA
jgi:hypothetical protein